MVRLALCSITSTILLLMMSGCPMRNEAKAEIKKGRCRANLQKILDAFAMYNAEHGYPQGDDVLRILMDDGKIKEDFVKCPQNPDAPGEFGYCSNPGVKMIEDEGKLRPLFWDKPDNHTVLGVVNVIYNDASIRSLTLDEFRELLEKDKVTNSQQ